MILQYGAVDDNKNKNIAMSKKRLADIVEEAREFIGNNDAEIDEGRDVVEKLLEWLDGVAEKITSSQ